MSFIIIATLHKFILKSKRGSLLDKQCVRLATSRPSVYSVVWSTWPSSASSCSSWHTLARVHRFTSSGALVPNTIHRVCTHTHTHTTSCLLMSFVRLNRVANLSQTKPFNPTRYASVHETLRLALNQTQCKCMCVCVRARTKRTPYFWVALLQK